MQIRNHSGGDVTQDRRTWISIVASRIVVVLGLALWCSIALAQSGAGSIQGTVQDATQAVIPGATIQVVNNATNVKETTKSSSTGFYLVPDLFAGDYTVSVTAPGMETYKTAIQLLVTQNAIINPVMTAGAVTQEITVSANAVQLTTTDNGSISSTLENQRVSQLPMNGRYLLSLTQMTTPGMENSGQQINGLPSAALEYVVDGATTTQLLNGGEHNGTVQLIDPDSVQEVNVKANGSSAQYATPGTGIVTTKSGTNQLHATFFETARNNGLGIAKRRQDAPNYAAPEYIRNEFGASAGGPVILPYLYHGKDKTFWFFAYERYSLAQNSTALGTVPTQAMSQGDFSGLVSSAGLVQQLYDPASTKSNTACPTPATVNGVQTWNGGKPNNNPYCRTPYGNGIGNSPANNQIPASAISPVAKLYYQLAPQPTSTANPLVSNNLTITEPSLQVIPQVTARMDHAFNESNRVYARYTQNLESINTGGGVQNLSAGGIPAGAAAGYTDSPTYSYIGGIGYTHIFSPTFFSETVASQQWFNTTYTTGVAYNTDYESMLGLPNNFGEPGFPSIGGSSLIFNLKGSQNPDESNQIISILDENLSKTLGKHQMQFGGRFRHTRVMDLPQLVKDSIAIGNLPTGIYNPSTGTNYKTLSNTGFADASFFVGSAGSYSVNLEYPHTHYHLNEVDGYFQDNYHVSKFLAVNLGLRYEAHPALWMKYGLANNFDLNNDAMVLSAPPSTLISEGYTTQAIITNLQNIGVKIETPTQAGLPSNLLKDYNLNFEPRIGAAYQLFGGKHGTVLRGAYGRYSYSTPFSQDQNQSAKNYPLAATYTQSYSAANQAIDGTQNELLRYNAPAKFGVMGVNTTNAVNTNVTNSILPGIAAVTLNPDSPPAFASEANVTIEQALIGNSALRISYIWTKATNLELNDSYNSQPSAYQWEMATGTAAPTGGASVIGTPQQNTYAATAMGPYDQTTWGANNMRERTGWSNYNALQASYQRLFHHGSAYQVSYVYAKGMQAAASQTIYPDANYPGVMGAVGTMTSPYGTIGFPGTPPPARPAGVNVWQDWHEMDRYQQYQLDGSTPKTHITFNGILDLPFGRGKRFFGNANRFLDELVGGFQLAGDGSIVSQVFQPAAGDWGPSNPLVVYKHKAPITDCRSGVCYKAYMWFNGYLPPTVTTGVAGSTCTSNCVTGLPASYVPDRTPIDNTPGTTYYGDNEVQVTLSNGTPQAVGYDAGPGATNTLSKTYLDGPINWNADLSLFKVFPITERVKLRFNMDAFNAFNVQGYNNPGSNGVQDVSPGLGACRA
jgi:hypothetical protein